MIVGVGVGAAFAVVCFDDGAVVEDPPPLPLPPQLPLVEPPPDPPAGRVITEALGEAPIVLFAEAMEPVPTLDEEQAPAVSIKAIDAVVTSILRLFTGVS